jgi:hypothetical protein
VRSKPGTNIGEAAIHPRRRMPSVAANVHGVLESLAIIAHRS